MFESWPEQGLQPHKSAHEFGHVLTLPETVRNVTRSQGSPAGLGTCQSCQQSWPGPRRPEPSMHSLKLRQVQNRTQMHTSQERMTVNAEIILCIYIYMYMLSKCNNKLKLAFQRLACCSDKPGHSRRDTLEMRRSKTL